MPRVELTALLARDARPGARDIVLFDRTLPGFGLRIHPSGRKVWILQARIDGRTRRLQIGRYGDMDLAAARRRARAMQARIRAGGNPAEDARRARTAPTVRELAEKYLRHCDPHWKPAGRESVRIYLRARILPAFGASRVDRIGPEDVAAWFDAASRTRTGAANRALEILRAMLYRAEAWGWREPGTNPCLGIRKNPRNHVARCLDAGELERVGRVLDRHESECPETVAAIRLLALTGCRRGEVLTLRWRQIGRDAITLEDSKTGPRAVPLGHAARTLLDELPGERHPDAFVFPALATGKSRQDRVRVRWQAMCEEAGIGKARLHDLRHTVASHAVMAGENLPLVGRMLGHRRHATTAGYAHLADAHLVETAERVGQLIADAMAARPGANP